MKISINNGASYCSPAEAIKTISFDTIINYMDNGTREKVHAELAPCSEIDFLARYLELAPSDLIIGWQTICFRPAPAGLFLLPWILPFSPRIPPFPAGIFQTSRIPSNHPDRPYSPNFALLWTRHGLHQTEAKNTAIHFKPLFRRFYAPAHQNGNFLTRTRATQIWPVSVRNRHIPMHIALFALRYAYSWRLDNLPWRCKFGSVCTEKPGKSVSDKKATSRDEMAIYIFLCTEYVIYKPL